MSQPNDIPSLDQVHSGVPARLRDDAIYAKKSSFALRTIPLSKPRQAPLRLPPDTSREKFDAAIVALKKVLGEKGVELNDKPLVDGWYMEHP
jgi:hypothetical protein